MKKILSNKNKIITILLILIFSAICVACVTIVASRGNDESVSVLDCDGVTVAKVSASDKGYKISAIDDDLVEYVDFAVNEAIDLYAEKFNISAEDKNETFFENASVINTYLVTDYVSKLKQGALDGNLKSNTPFASVILSHDGEILAVYGSDDTSGSRYTVKKTYAGSAIKPLSVYAPLIDSGKATCSTAFDDSPIKKITDAEGRYVDWPSNASGDYTHSKITLAEGLQKSLNTIAVHGLKELSVKESVSFLEKNFGMNLEYEKLAMEKVGEDEILGSIALGYLNEGVSPVDMAGYYQIFANDGIYTSPSAVSSIETSDGKSYSLERISKTVISPVTASIMREMLKLVISREGTAYGAYVEDVELAGKSGTSDGFADNWFVGFTADYICSVWHGYDEISENRASKIFSNVISQLPITDNGFVIHKDIIRNLYCKKTGQLKGKACRATGEGFYNKSNVPSKCTVCE